MAPSSGFLLIRPLVWWLQFFQVVVKSVGLRITDERFKRFSATDVSPSPSPICA